MNFPFLVCIWWYFIHEITHPLCGAVTNIINASRENFSPSEQTASSTLRRRIQNSSISKKVRAAYALCIQQSRRNLSPAEDFNKAEFPYDCSEYALYPAGVIDPDYAGTESSPERYDVGCIATTHEDGPLADIRANREDRPREGDVLLSLGLERQVTALVGVPAVSMQREDRDLRKEAYVSFLESINTINARVGDRANNWVEAYVPPDRVEAFADRFAPEGNAEVFMGIREYLAENVKYQNDGDGRFAVTSDQVW